MGIDNIEELHMDDEQTAGTREPAEEPTKDESPSPPMDADSPSEKTTYHAADSDHAPDADEPGDEELPEDLQDVVHEGDVKPDEVDQRPPEVE